MKKKLLTLALTMTAVMTASAIDNNTVEIVYSGTTATAATDADHTDEDTGNFYMDGGTLAISGYADKAVKADGTISFSGGTQNFDTTDITENATTGIAETFTPATSSTTTYYDLHGRQVDASARGLLIIKNGNTTRKVLVK